MSGDYISREAAIKSTWMILEGMGYPRDENKALERTLEAVFDSAPAADVVDRPKWISKDRLEEIFLAEREGRVRIKARPIEDTCGSCRWFDREEGTASGKCTRRTRKYRGGMDSGATLYVTQAHRACKSDYERRSADG